jgi:prepilin-type N-terminal cleavage/methylation domain-containing protein
MQKGSGFTLIELVIVIVILGILAVVAIPQYVSLTNEASTAAVSGIAGSLASANSINYAARKANSAKGIAVSNCTDVSNALVTPLPVGYTITSLAVSADTTTTCTLNGPNSTTATFVATGIA